MKAIDYVRIALSLETLAYHDKNYLDGTLAKSNCKISEEVQRLLREAEAALQKGGIHETDPV